MQFGHATCIVSSVELPLPISPPVGVSAAGDDGLIDSGVFKAGSPTAGWWAYTAPDTWVWTTP